MNIYVPETARWFHETRGVCCNYVTFQLRPLTFQKVQLNLLTFLKIFILNQRQFQFFFFKIENNSMIHLNLKYICVH